MSLEDTPAPAPGPSKTVKWLVGCTIGMVLIGLCCAGAAWFGMGALQGWAAEQAQEGLNAFIEESRLPEDQAQSARSDVQRLRVAIEEGRIGLETFEKLETMEGELERLVTLGLIQWFGASMVPETEGLTEEEVADSQRTMQRLGRAVQEQTINHHEAASPINVQIEIRGNGELNADDVRVVTEKVRTLVDDLAIPDEPYVIDVASEFRGLIDGLLD